MIGCNVLYVGGIPEGIPFVIFEDQGLFFENYLSFKGRVVGDLVNFNRDRLLKFLEDKDFGFLGYVSRDVMDDVLLSRFIKVVKVKSYEVGSGRFKDLLEGGDLSSETFMKVCGVDLYKYSLYNSLRGVFKNIYIF